MALLGLVLLIIGLILGFHLLVLIGAILLVLGLIAFAVGSAGHPIYGRRHYW